MNWEMWVLSCISNRYVIIGTLLTKSGKNWDGFFLLLLFFITNFATRNQLHTNCSFCNQTVSLNYSRKIMRFYCAMNSASIYPQIRNLIGCSGTMPEKLQGSFSSTRSLYKRNVRRHKPPLPHKAA